MNLSRAYSIVYNEELSVGRVQTPTLAMIVDRELALRRFVPEDYLHVVATFQATALTETYDGTWFRPDVKTDESSRLAADGKEAEQIMARAKTGHAAIETLSSETVRTPPPLLYDLTDLQRHANRLYGFSAQKTLDLAQTLYEQHKLISYPRTDSRHLSTDIAETLPKIVQAISGPLSTTIWLREQASAPWASAMSTTPRSAITTPLFPPRLSNSQIGSPMRKARFTTWSAGACSCCGMTTTCRK